ncbi:MAG: class I tRNA ligase family protein, partial [Armatimonadetes bacterium]|nr:class I tRNA ligase family protein [Armatimonadota bacterium]
VAPFEAEVQGSNEGMHGAVRFLNRVFRLAAEFEGFFGAAGVEGRGSRVEGGVMVVAGVRRKTHQTIQKVTSDIDGFSFNTAVSALMIFVGSLEDACIEVARAQGASGSAGEWADDSKAWREAGYSAAGPEFVEAMKEALVSLTLLLSPIAPHSADEIWRSFGKEGFTFDAAWPVADESLTVEDTITVAVQVQGKLRDTIELPAGASKEQLEEAALASEKVQNHLAGKTVKKVIVVPGKLVNIVAD